MTDVKGVGKDEESMPDPELQAKPDSPDRPRQAVVEVRRPQDAARVQRRPVHRPGRGADLLRGARDVPGAAGVVLPARRRRPGAEGGQGDHRHHEAAGQRGHPQHVHAGPRGPGQVPGCRAGAGHRSRRRAVVGLRLRRRVRPGDEPDLRDRRGPAVLEAAPADARHHPGRRPAVRAGPGDARRLRPARPVDRRRRSGWASTARDRLEHREVAGHRRHRDDGRRAALLRHPQRQAAEVPVDLRRRRRRDRHLGARVGRLRVLRRRTSPATTRPTARSPA